MGGRAGGWVSRWVGGPAGGRGDDHTRLQACPSYVWCWQWPMDITPAMCHHRRFEMARTIVHYIS